ncbi:MAG: family 10 glycosylhydrolase [Acidobacteria bacterium]|nr:family 10 glycosylhydrolase [Acidobacteriota bacterium]
MKNRVGSICFVIWLLAAMFGSPLLGIAQRLPEPERDFRAVWIATVDNIDFPSKKGISEAEQKAEIIRDLDLVQRLRMNAVVFQVRPAADALYRSEIEPWSEYLTGQMGKPQDLDPLEFLVAEAHKRGILVHAWFNPYRAYHPSATTMSDGHISKTRPELVRQYGKYLWMDPTDTEVQKLSIRVIQDVVSRYDIDGVHFDDYFYPYIEKDAEDKDIPFPDDKNWEAYLKTAGNKPMSRSDWRRMHVNNFIEAVGRKVKKTKPHVMYGISPFGIWRPMPELGIEGFDAYEGLYADSRKWLRDGTVDYFTPQLYWETARRAQSYPILLDWWKSQNPKKRHIWPGLATYRIGRNEDFTAKEIISQIERTRLAPETRGSIFFNFKSIRNDTGGIQAALLENVYRRSAIIPPSPWIKAKSPSTPKVTIERGAEFTVAKWTETGSVKAFWFVVYAKDKNGWSHSVLPASERSIALSGERGIEQIIVKSVDRLGNVSK